MRLLCGRASCSTGGDRYKATDSCLADATSIKLPSTRFAKLCLSGYQSTAFTWRMAAGGALPRLRRELRPKQTES